MQTPPVALIITSNDLDNQLHQIETERECIEKALSHYHNNHQLLVITSQYTSIDKLFSLLNEHSGNIVLLHFAGHFGTGLNLNDSDLKTEIANNKGIANVLGKEATDGILKFVFLNGCSTKSLVEDLRKKNVPSIIGTNYPIGDGTATEFANTFYRKLANTDAKNPFSQKPTTLIAAFEFALGKLETKNTVIKDETKRGFIFKIEALATTERWELDSIHNDWYLSNTKYKPKDRTGQLAAISCDRKQIIKRFEINLDKKEGMGLPCQFYFLAEQPFGEVESLLKRLVHHLCTERPKTKPVNHEDIEPIEIDSVVSNNQEDIEYSLRKGFNKDFSKNHQVKFLKELIEAIPTQHPQLKEYTHLPFYFKINMTDKCWENQVQAALKWFINTFAAVEESKYQFIFFFIINIKKARKSQTAKKGGFFSSIFGKKETEQIEAIDIYKVLQQFSENIEQVTTLPPLTKVERQDLDDWYKRYEKNAADRQIEVDKLVDKLIHRIGHDEPWDMSHVESELKKIVEEKNSMYAI